MKQVELGAFLVGGAALVAILGCSYLAGGWAAIVVSALLLAVCVENVQKVRDLQQEMKALREFVDIDGDATPFVVPGPRVAKSKEGLPGGGPDAEAN